MLTAGQWSGRLHLSAIRSTVIIIWLVIVANYDYAICAAVPSHLLEGYGLGRIIVPLVLHLPFEIRVVLEVLRWMAILTGMATLLLQRCGWAWIWGFFSSVAILDAFVKSLGGFANHGQTLSLLLLALFAVCGRRKFVPVRHLLDESWDRQDDSSLLWLCQLIVALPYTFIALHRTIVGGVALFTSNDILGYVAITSSGFSARPHVAYREYPLVFQVGFVVVTLMELTTTLAFCNSRFRIVWLSIMLPFHITTGLLMNILFWENLLVVTVALWPRKERVLVVSP